MLKNCPRSHPQRCENAQSFASYVLKVAMVLYEKFQKYPKVLCATLWKYPHFYEPRFKNVHVFCAIV